MLTIHADLSPALEQLENMGTRAGKTIRKAAFEGTDLIYWTAVAFAPISKKPHWFYGSTGQRYLFEPGSLIDSLYIKHIEEVSEKGVREVYQVSWRKRSSELGYVPYAHMVEYGTVRTPPAPFVRPAYDMAKTQAESLIIDIIMKAVNQNG